MHTASRCVGHSYADGRGLEVSLSDLLENQLVQRQIGDRSSEPYVFPLDLLEASSLLDLQAAVGRPWWPVGIAGVVWGHGLG